MKTPCMTLLAALCSVAFAEPERIVLENGALRAEITPAWGGRLTYLGRHGGENALWSDPSAATNTVDAKGRPVWKNVGGEKTWVGTMGLWKDFKAEGEGGGNWPPPAWFDSAPLDVVRADATNVLLRSAEHASGDWTLALEREFTLEGDSLVLNERLCNVANVEMLPIANANAILELETGIGNTGNNGNTHDPLPDDPRRVWSVTQIPLVDTVRAHLAGEGRSECFLGCPALSAPDAEGWAELDLSAAPKNARIELDGDALSADIPGAGRLVIEQTADARHLGAFAKPSRAIVYTTGKDFKPSKWSGYGPQGYIELEFTALGPDAKQTVSFRLSDTTE